VLTACVALHTFADVGRMITSHVSDINRRFDVLEQSVIAVSEAVAAGLQRDAQQQLLQHHVRECLDDVSLKLQRHVTAAVDGTVRCCLPSLLLRRRCDAATMCRHR
jgi:hypothetical protein